MTNDNSWYALYTRGKQERKVCRQLEKKGIPHYCPLHFDQVIDQGEEKTISKPIFDSTVFCPAGGTDISTLLAIPGVVNIKYWQSAPALVPGAELKALGLFLGHHSQVKAIKISLDPTGGESGPPVMKFEAAENNYILQLPAMGYQLVAAAGAQSVKLISSHQSFHRTTENLEHLFGIKRVH